MSNRTVQQVKALITADLSVVEKAQLVEWFGADLRRQERIEQGLEDVLQPY